MIDYAKKKNIKKTFEYYYKVFEILQLIYEEGNPSGIKNLLKTIGICNEYLRLPLIEPTIKLRNKIENAIIQYNL
jgi:4-hydroxy-tetrahydrodipicolinate synthase